MNNKSVANMMYDVAKINGIDVREEKWADGFMVTAEKPGLMDVIVYDGYIDFSYASVFRYYDIPAIREALGEEFNIEEDEDNKPQKHDCGTFLVTRELDRGEVDKAILLWTHLCRLVPMLEMDW